MSLKLSKEDDMIDSKKSPVYEFFEISHQWNLQDSFSVLDKLNFK
jgi:hypothetical protein